MRNRPLCFVLFSLISAGFSSSALNAVSVSADGDQLPEAEAQPVVVSATRFDIPLDQSPASVSVIDSQDFENQTRSSASRDALARSARIVGGSNRNRGSAHLRFHARFAE